MKDRPAPFMLGRCVSTPGALDLLSAHDIQPVEFIVRHQHGDWGDLDTHDREANDLALLTEGRIFSAYILSAGEKIWVITEADRSMTTILLPSEY